MTNPNSAAKTATLLFVLCLALTVFLWDWVVRHPVLMSMCLYFPWLVAVERMITAISALRAASAPAPAIEARRVRNQRMLDVSLTIITQHAAELRLRRRQLTTQRNHGIVDDSLWLAEVDYFIDELIDGRGGDIGSNPRLLGIVEAMIQTATADYDDARTGFSKNVDPPGYEQRVARHLTDLGWHTRLTEVSGDQAVDIVAEMQGRRVVIQCNRYEASIGNAAVQIAHEGKSYEAADFSAVVSNVDFARETRQLARANDVILLHHDELAKLERHIFGALSTS